MHQPFTSPKPKSLAHLNKGDYAKIRANANDIGIKGVEVGGGSIRVFDKTLQGKMFEVLGFLKNKHKLNLVF
jgi:aspartyl-tRNA synthetase